MPKNSVSDWDTTAANNTDVGGIDINEGCPAANINNAIRETMAQIKTYSGTIPAFSTVNTYTKIQKWAKGADVASATSLTLGDDGNYFDITGTTAITSIATKGVGTVVKLHFDAGLTLTHQATDLILPGGANIITAAGDEAEFVEYATGDWRCTDYTRASENWVDVASATTTDIGAAASKKVRITGTTTITGLGTVAAGIRRQLRFAGVLTLTHNGTSLILPGASNFTTAAGDVFDFVSEGSGNWRCVGYMKADGPQIIGGAIKFPATQVASADANALDDYEEGTFTPRIDGTLLAGSGSYTTQFGRYTKIGRLVQFEIALTWGSHSGTGNMICSNLPFTSHNDTTTNTPVSILSSALTFSGQLVAYVPNSSTQVQIRTISNGASVGDVAMDINASVWISGSYSV